MKKMIMKAPKLNRAEHRIFRCTWWHM